ncbi:hypothetical protein L3X38_032994 [Prunus dulcis]|uniref:Uncharacterized protein n=1 Tax=Prunus dulcis TaxID=3755 RepID=A0AAD4VG83_PRUDU|nr:hypothetical protein L3X38_032994 [Prunus dulcis]
MKNNKGGSGFDDGAKGVEEIHDRALMKALSNKACLVAINTTINVPFDTEHPLTSNGVVRGLGRNKLPRAITKESIEFIRHGSTPKRIFNSLRDTCGFKGRGNRCLVAAYKCLGLKILFLAWIILGWLMRGQGGEGEEGSDGLDEWEVRGKDVGDGEGA